MAVRAEDMRDDRPDDQFTHDFVQERHEGVQHYISEMLESVGMLKSPGQADRAEYFDDEVMAYSEFPGKCFHKHKPSLREDNYGPDPCVSRPRWPSVRRKARESSENSEACSLDLGEAPGRVSPFLE